MALKQFYSISQIVFNSRLICLRTSTLVTHLFHIQSAKESAKLHTLNQKEDSALYRRYVTSKVVEYFLVLMIMFRMLYITVRFDEQDRQSLNGHLSYNPVFIFALQQSSFFNMTLLRYTSLMALFVIVFDYSVYFGMNLPLIGPTWEFMVANGDNFWQLNKLKSGNNCFVNWQFYQSFWTSSNAKFSRPMLSSFPALSNRTRVRMVLFSAAVDAAIACFNVLQFTIIASLCLWLLCALATSQSLSVGQLTLASVDLTLMGYFSWKTIREIIFTLHILYMMDFMFFRHMAELNGSLRAVVLSQSQLTMFRYRTLDYFYKEYLRLLTFARINNQQTVSPIMLCTLITHLTLNLLAIGFLLFRRLHRGEQAMLLCFVVGQVLICTLACLGFVSTSDIFNRSSALLYRAQLSLVTSASGPKNAQLYKKVLLTTAKLKLMVFFEQVCRRRGDEFRFTVGSLCKISQKSLYEFIFVYSGLGMYVVTMIKKGRL